eukprot:COSAG06_NODE_23084_length_703_cov_0.920530_2_plen_51_part_01
MPDASPVASQAVDDATMFAAAMSVGVTMLRKINKVSALRKRGEKVRGMGAR